MRRSGKLIQAAKYFFRIILKIFHVKHFGPRSLSNTKAKHAPESLALQGLPQVAVAMWPQMWTCAGCVTHQIQAPVSSG
jgi:hypothetical protein